MKLIYRNPGYKYSVKSFAEFIKQDDFWNKPIFHFYPELLKYKGQFNKNDDNKEIIKVISPSVEKLYKSREDEIQNKVFSYQEHWNNNEALINERFTCIFQFDTSKVFNDLVCNITLNPISPRYLKEHVFDVFYMSSEKGATGSALHEITHYLWFYLWNQRYKDSYTQYATPSLIWVLSEAVVEQILSDKELKKINPYSKDGVAYPYFYKITIKGRPFYNYLNEIYEDHTMIEFMDKSYQFMLENEKEIRSQMF